MESEELRTLQLHYAELHREKEASDLLATRATVHAQQLSTQIHDVQNALQLSLSNKPDESALAADELAAFSGMDGLTHNNKTMKFSAPSSPLDLLSGMGGTDRNMRLFGFARSDIGTERSDPDMASDPYDRASKRGSDGSRQSHQSRQSGTVGSVGTNPAFYAYSSNPGYFNLDQGQTTHTQKDSILSDCEEEDDAKFVEPGLGGLQEDFEERIAELRKELQAKHEREMYSLMREWEMKMADTSEQMTMLKRRLLESKAEVKELKTIRDGKEGGNETTLSRRSRNSRSPRDGTEKNCIIFGWTAW